MVTDAKAVSTGMKIEKPKKSRRPPIKKVSRACVHCRNAHITCDDNRPCLRCVKKGTADTCVDAPRKVKKYLEGIEIEKIKEEPKPKSRSMLLSRSLPAVYNTDNINADTNFNYVPTQQTPLPHLNTLPNIIFPSLPNPLSTPQSPLPLPPTLQSQSQQPHARIGSLNSQSATMANGFIGKLHVPSKDEINFMSSAADSEYAILGNIIDQSMFNTTIQSQATTFPTPMNPPISVSSYRQESPALSHTNSDDFDIMHYQPLMAPDDSSPSLISSHETSRNTSPFLKPLLPLQMGVSGIQTEHIRDLTENVERKLQYTDLYPDEPQCDVATNQYFIGTMSTIDGVKTHTFPEVLKQISKFKRKNLQQFKERNRKSAISFSIGIIDDVLPEFESTDVEKKNEEPYSPKCGLMYHEPSEIYEKVKSPFAYVKPYHDLNLYLKSRFSKDNLVQVSKSIAEYRPSFIAGMIKLKEDDLIFAEQCFQRTLLEYDSYIGISGTPTMVWRRTSQIAYVGDEFCILTGWSKEDLVGKSTFAVEIMDDKSCVEYFKIFSKIAFGDMSGETMTECTLLTPRGESIRTSSTWTLKRDVFGIPMMIIATFLPILT